MSDFLLAQGSIVKTAILSTELAQLLEHGLGGDPQAPQSGAIAIGELSTYYRAGQLFSKHLQQLHTDNQDLLANFVGQLQAAPGQLPASLDPALAAVAAQAAFPVILEIELAQNCRLQADDHYAPGSPETSWKTWRSGWLELPEGRLPAGWVRRFYFPRLIDFRAAANARSGRNKEQSTDVALVTGGYMQFHHKDAPGGLLAAFQRHYGRINFSQSLNFDAAGVNRFETLHALQDSACRLMNQMSLWQDLLAMTQKQKIDLLGQDQAAQPSPDKDAEQASQTA